MAFKKMIIIVGILFLLAGCTHAYHPRKHVRIDNPDGAPDIISTKLDALGPYPSGCTVWLVNDISYNGSHTFKKGRGNKFVANYFEWTAFLVEEWAEQLVQRGVTVSEKSPNVIYVSVRNFNIDQGAFVANAELDVKLQRYDSDWSRIYYGQARRPAPNFSAAVYQTIAKLLENKDVINQMKSK